MTPRPEGRGRESVLRRERGGEGKRAGVDFIISFLACCGDIRSTVSEL